MHMCVSLSTLSPSSQQQQTPTILRGNELREATGVRQDAQEAEGALHQLAKSLRGEILTTCRMEQQTRPNSAELDRFLSTLQA